MVNDPAEYKWSSYQINGLGKESALCKPHEQYNRLAKSKSVRLESYRTLFKSHVEGAQLKDIRQATNKGMAIGTDIFKQQIEELTGRRIKSAKMGAA